MNGCGDGVNGFRGSGTSKKKAKTKAPDVKPTCGPPKFVSGFIVRATRQIFAEVTENVHFNEGVEGGKKTDKLRWNCKAILLSRKRKSNINSHVRSSRQVLEELNMRLQLFPKPL